MRFRSRRVGRRDCQEDRSEEDIEPRRKGPHPARNQGDGEKKERSEARSVSRTGRSRCEERRFDRQDRDTIETTTIDEGSVYRSMANALK